MSARISSQRWPIRGYNKIKEVGSGSFGAAILVKDGQGKQYVLKAIDISRMGTKERKDAANEVKVLSSLKHPYIVAYKDSFIEDGFLNIVMEYADGGDLFTRIQKAKKSMQKFGEQQILRWFTQALLALKFIHDKHILHRDLKSQNFFLMSNGKLKIGDFGIAKVLDNTAACAQTTIGTPYYLSPEICQERPYSWASDMWSLGCVLYECCCLKVPFDASNLRQLIDRITRGPTPTVVGNFSAELKGLVQELLERNYQKRPAAAEILQRPIVQSEIRRMLLEEQAVKEKNVEKAGESSELASVAPVSVAPAAAAPGTDIDTPAESSTPPQAAPAVDRRVTEVNSGAPRPPMAPQRYQVGERVEYRSDSQKRWIPATITATDPRGAVQVDVKPNWWIEAEAQVDKIRRRRPSDAPESFERFEKNERVEYKSDTHKSWVPAVVQAVDPKTGAIQLDVKPGFWLEPSVISEKVRRCKPGTPRGSSVRTPSPARARDASPSRAPSVSRLPSGERQATPSKRSSTPSARRLWPDAVPSRCYTPLRGRPA
jgi:NIMA (never in mitosis gene a)-related kinase